MKVRVIHGHLSALGRDTVAGSVNIKLIRFCIPAKFHMAVLEIEGFRISVIKPDVYTVDGRGKMENCICDKLMCNIVVAGFDEIASCIYKAMIDFIKQFIKRFPCGRCGQSVIII